MPQSARALTPQIYSLPRRGLPWGGTLSLTRPVTDYPSFVRVCGASIAWAVARGYRQELKQIEWNPIAADNIVDGAKWVLTPDLYCGEQLGPRSRVWFLAIDPPKAKPIGLYYAFDDHTVPLHVDHAGLTWSVGSRCEAGPGRVLARIGQRERPVSVQRTHD